ncbi:MAG TPA: prenyltransferase/squalene oxidase repeat-containing protein, partial [Solirubrobacter sp.]|nr:prenyltransferase/squalene oxidase repeat-containing protein [Solirubrobacter sp.]
MKGLVAAAAIAAVLVPASPAFAGDEAAARAAARRGAEWLRGLQQPDGSGLGGFGLTALAAGGVHPADVRVSDGPSAQERAQADWAASGAGPRGTDLARSLLAAHAAGIDPTLITEQRNFVAETLALFDGQRLYDPGAASSLSDDIFGTLGLAAVGAPQPILDALAAFVRSQQTASGGWNFTEGAANASVDMTGAAVGALCAAGVPASDPALAKALAFLRERQDPVTAGWGQNSDTTGWVVSGLRLCREELASWARNGRDPLDDLMSRQLPSGGFRWRDTDTTENALATLDSIRPLGGAGFTADPPGGRRLAPPRVPDGTEVPVGVVVDYGVAVRACAARAPVGAPLETAITAAPCVSEWGTGAWTVAHRDASGVVRAGDVISLRRTIPPAVAPLPVPAVSAPARVARETHITRVVRR